MCEEGGSSLLTSEYKLDSASPFSEQERDSSEASPTFSSSAARLLSNDYCGPRLRVILWLKYVLDHDRGGDFLKGLLLEMFHFACSREKRYTLFYNKFR